MGAEQFQNDSKLKDADEAFAEQRDQALYEYGHRGYTGTIGEKSGFRVWEPPAGHSYDEVVAALTGYYISDSERPSWVPEWVWGVYNDKWGDCIAIPNPEGGWTFVGWASS